MLTESISAGTSTVVLSRIIARSAKLKQFFPVKLHTKKIMMSSRLKARQKLTHKQLAIESEAEPMLLSAIVDTWAGWDYNPLKQRLFLGKSRRQLVQQENQKQ
jgi:hypothetical protein